jgi:hypothetical protein
MHFNWAVYSFLNGHFSSSIESQGLPFTIHLACNTTESGCSLFHEFANNAAVFNSGHDFLNTFVHLVTNLSSTATLSIHIVSAQVPSLRCSGNYSSQ